MDRDMGSISLKSLRFDDPPFRKLGNMEIPIAERITLIAGHNGIGKSTILGFIANGSGLRGVRFQNYLKRAFEHNVHEIVHLDLDKDFDYYKSKGLPLPAPYVTYEIAGLQLVKRCSLTITSRKKGDQVRVVPRNQPYETLVDGNGNEILGKDAKVPLPTIFLGMTRMLPIGESDPSMVESNRDEEINAEDAEFIHEFIDSIIGTGIIDAVGHEIYTQGVKSTKKTAKHPGYSYNTKCISLGQDSLSAIATALASFKRLQREWQDYPGGLLVVDELDAGFHPHAQHALVTALRKAARQLCLQVVATTHSLHLLELVHPDSNPIGPKGKRVDSVVYLTDTTKPRVVTDITLKQIQDDMKLTPPTGEKPPKKLLTVLLEDLEADFVFTRLLTRSFRKRIKTELGVQIKSLAVHLGGDQLTRLPKLARAFRSVVIVLDADKTPGRGKRQAKNIACLPGAKGSSGRGLPPEATLHSFVTDLVNAKEKYKATLKILGAAGITGDQLRFNVLAGAGDISKREHAKAWMNSKLQHIKNWKLIEHWMNEHPAEVKKFEAAFLSAAKEAVANF